MSSVFAVVAQDQLSCSLSRSKSMRFSSKGVSLFRSGRSRVRGRFQGAILLANAQSAQADVLPFMTNQTLCARLMEFP